jgi:nucleotide-binding universal stress UspA family protein
MNIIAPNGSALEIRLILCPVDFSEFSVRAYRHALSVAEHYHAKLVALHTVELWRHPSFDFAPTAKAYDESCRALCRNGEEQLRELLKNNMRGEVHTETMVEVGNAADSILAFAQNRKADVIVMGTHGRRGYDRFVLGSVTERVMRSAGCPVLVVSKPQDDFLVAGDEPGEAHRLRRILFCTDFSPNAEQALSYAISAATEYDAELILLHVLHEIPSAAKTEQAVVAATERLEQLIPPESRETLHTKLAVRVGKPYEQIIRLSQEAPTDMVVMAVRGRGTLDLAVFGSTTYRVIQMGSCPVLVVHIS